MSSIKTSVPIHFHRKRPNSSMNNKKESLMEASIAIEIAT